MIRICRLSKASPTSVKPKTAPPLKATIKPYSSEFWHIFVVLTLALTAIHIPIYPANVDDMAPSKNANVV